MNFHRSIANQDIRQELRDSNIPFWLVARHFGVSEVTFSRWMRDELSEARRQKIRAFVATIKAEDSGVRV